MNQYEIPTPEEVNLSNIYKLALQKVEEFHFSDFKKWALFGFENDEWDQFLDFVLGASKEELIKYVEEQEIDDENGNPVYEEK
jgi:hypothetical protein